MKYAALMIAATQAVRIQNMVPAGPAPAFSIKFGADDDSWLSVDGVEVFMTHGWDTINTFDIFMDVCNGDHVIAL